MPSMRMLVAGLWLMLTCSAAAADCRSLESVEWILGEWTSTAGEVSIREYWHRVSDLTFEGESITRSLADDDIVNYETLRLVSMSDGVFYIAKVAHNEFPVPFRLTRCGEREAVFENPLHDAPERLVYRLLQGADAGALEVRVEGGEMDDFSLLFYRP